MQLTVALSLVFLVSSAAAQAPVDAPKPPFSGISASIAALSKMTGLRPLKKVAHDTINKTKLKEYLEQRAKEELKPEEVRMEELTLKKFGLVPLDFDLRGTMVDLLTEQAAAFYDYREKKLYLMEGATQDSQDLFVFHELAHALADQHFDLAKYIRKGGKNDDSSMARMAVMEGQATWLMFEFLAEKMGQSLRTNPGAIDLLSRVGTDQFSAQYPILSNAPLYIRASLMFPYMDGLRFQNALVAKLDTNAFSKPFKNPPSTTQQILHPDKYLAGVMAVEPVLPKLTSPKEWNVLAEGTVGEFDHSILLEQYVNKEEAASISPKWRGGSFAICENKRDKRTVLLYASEWEDEKSAQAVFADYQRVLQGKWKKFDVKSRTPSRISGSGDDGEFVVFVSGNRVLAAEGLESLSAVQIAEN